MPIIPFNKPYISGNESAYMLEAMASGQISGDGMFTKKCHNFFVIEDAAQSIDSCYKGKPLGSIGHLACFSFHETKNLISGEGGMLVINDEQFIARAEIIRDKGILRMKFILKNVTKK